MVTRSPGDVPARALVRASAESTRSWPMLDDEVAGGEAGLGSWAAGLHPDHGGATALSGLDLDAEEPAGARAARRAARRVARRAARVGHQLFGQAERPVDGDGERFVGCGLEAVAGGTGRRGVHADDLAAGAGQGPARVARHHLGVDLDHVREGLAVGPVGVGGRDLLVQADDLAGGHRRLAALAPGVADGGHLVAHGHAGRVAQGHGGEVRSALERQDGHVVGRDRRRPRWPGRSRRCWPR